jgi:phosphoribosylamine---glycine ligase
VRVLVVGSGGREHALAWKLAQEAEVIAAPGNPGIAEDVEVANVRIDDTYGLIDLCKARKIDLVVVGPEDPLVNGLADHFRDTGIAVFGPGAAGAALEASKAFSKDLMKKAGIPTAAYQTFTHPEPAKMFARSLFDGGRSAVVKASGNALGKGVIVAASIEEAEDAVDAMLVDKEFGDAGTVVVVEEAIRGREFSLLTLCSGKGILSLPVAQDHKRALDGDRGPNTGGMGTYSPVPAISDDLVLETEDRVVRPILECLKSEGIPYRGVLFSGLMGEPGQTYCLEYNVRFGDPETQTVMMRLGKGFAEALMACANGEPIPPIEVIDNSVVTVVVASGGYPGPVEKGLPITLPTSLPQGVKIFHAGTKRTGSELVTNGGRVFAVAAAAADLPTARQLAYESARNVQFAGRRFREDIANLATADV